VGRPGHQKWLERTTAVLLLALLHAALFALLNPKFGTRIEPQVIELDLTLPPPPPKEIEQVPIEPAFAAPKIPRFRLNLPQRHVPPVATAPQSPEGVIGLGKSLFNCTLGITNTLPLGENPHCARLAVPRSPADTADIGMPKTSRAVQSPRWAAALAARRAPPSVPCTHLEQTIMGGFGAQKPVTALMADPLCLLKALAHGQPK